MAPLFRGRSHWPAPIKMFKPNTSILQLGPQHSVEYRWASQVANASTLVLLNGSLCNMKQWSLSLRHPAWQPILQRYSVLLFNYSGSGKSIRPDRRWCIKQLASETCLLLDALDIQNAHFFGVSKGTGVLQAIAALQPDRILTAAGYGWIHLTHPAAPKVAHRLRSRVKGFETAIDQLASTGRRADTPLNRASFRTLWKHVLRDILLSARKGPQGRLRQLKEQLTCEFAYPLLTPMTPELMAAWFSYGADLFESPPSLLTQSEACLRECPLQIHHGRADVVLPAKLLEDISLTYPKADVRLYDKPVGHISALVKGPEIKSMAEGYRSFLDKYSG